MQSPETLLLDLKNSEDTIRHAAAWALLEYPQVVEPLFPLLKEADEICRPTITPPVKCSNRSFTL